MKASTRTGIWIGIVCAQLALDAWLVFQVNEQGELLRLVNASLRLDQQERARETRYTTQIHGGWVFRSQPRTGAVEIFNPKTREWVALGAPGWVPASDNPINWGDKPAASNDPRDWGAVPIEP